MSPLPDPGLLMRRLITIADREHDALLGGEDAWEAVMTAREEFDAGFAQLEKAVQQRPLTSNERNDLVRLNHVHSENLRLAEQLRLAAGGRLKELSNVRKLGGYAPLGDGNRPSPRYLDSSA